MGKGTVSLIFGIIGLIFAIIFLIVLQIPSFTTILYYYSMTILLLFLISFISSAVFGIVAFIKGLLSVIKDEGRERILGLVGFILAITTLLISLISFVRFRFTLY
jgi:hypothetical protein